MDMPDWEEEEKARRKKEIVEYRTKKTRSTIFMLCASVFEIAETLILMLGLFLLMSFILFRLCDESQQAVQIAFQILSIVVFIGNKKIKKNNNKLNIKAIINKFNLKDKLTDDVVFHFKKKKKNETEEALRK